MNTWFRINPSSYKSFQNSLEENKAKYFDMTQKEGILT